MRLRIIFMLAGLLGLTGAYTRIAAQSDFIPITPDNISEIQLLSTIEDYYDAGSFCACDIRLFSLNGRAVATDQKAVDLLTGATLDFSGRGYPLTLHPAGTHVVVSGQNTGTRLVEINTGIEQLMIEGDAEGAAFSQDGALIALTSRDADAVQVWQVSGLSLLATLGQPTPRVIYVDTYALQFTADGRYLIWLDRDLNLHFWDVQKQTEAWYLVEDMESYRPGSDQQTLIFTTYDSDTLAGLDTDTQEKVRQIAETHNQVYSYALSADRDTLAIKHANGIELWNIQRLEKVAEIEDPTASDVLFTPDNRYLILSQKGTGESCDRERSGCSGRNRSEDIRLVDVATGQVVEKVTPPDGSSIYTTSLIADGGLLITSGYYWNDTFHLWRLDGAELTLITSLPGSNVWVSPDESTLLVNINDQFLGVYGIPTETRPVQQFIMPGRIVASSINVRAEPNGEAEVIGTVSGQVRVLGRSEAGDYVYLPDAEGWIRADGSYLDLALDLPVEALHVIDPTELTSQEVEPTSTTAATSTATPAPLDELAVPLENLALPVGEPVIQPPAPQDDLIPISAQNVEDVTLLAVLPATTIRRDEEQIVIPEISLDGTRLITPPLNEQTHPSIWDLRTFERQDGPDIGASDFWIVMVASPDGKHIVFTPHKFNYPLQLWSSDSQTSEILPIDPYSLFNAMLAFSPDGKYLAYPQGIMEVTSAEQRLKLDNTGKLVYSPDGTRLGIITHERAYIYDAETGELLTRTPRVEEYNYLMSGKFSPDSATFVAATSDGIEVYDTETGTLLYAPQYEDYFHNWEIENVAFSPDGALLAAINPQGILQVWDNRSGESLGVYDTGGAQGLAFNPNGQLLAIGNPLRLIDLASGKITTVNGSYGGSLMQFSPDGSSLLIDTADNYFDQTIHSVMVFGVPDTNRATWQPESAQITASTINVRSGPDGAAPMVDTVAGMVTILARDDQAEAIYIAEPAGWIWAAPEYVDLGQISMESLPVRASLTNGS